jgi:hypothetical protein
VTEGENLNPGQQESLNPSKRFFYDFFCKQQRAKNINSQKYFIFSTQVGKG